MFLAFIPTLKCRAFCQSFVNPEFTLYQAPLDIPFIFPTQLHRFIQSFNKIPSKLNGQHKSLAGFLIKQHQDESPYHRLPTYDYD
ncbi:hypothetical protein AB6N22_12800, partial [Kocuria palustris]|uniref:hypothetical protein n=1 Tax=Kocuria palustris TaxID=71999 RepID=UPI00399FD230